MPTASTRAGRICAIALAVLIAAEPRAAWSALEGAEAVDLGRLSIEELANLEITSVSKTKQPIAGAPASIYVITPEEIRRSGALSIPETLTIAPNLNVRRLSSSTYAISARGFDTYESSNKLLAMIDGRSIYSSLHSGVFWDNYDVLLADIDRIEVVSGPGGTLWGANAVNGVINIITKSSRDTQGGAFDVAAGDRDWAASARYGGKVNDQLTYRFYAKGMRHGAAQFVGGASAHDDFTQAEGGARSDWQGESDEIMLQGDYVSGDYDHIPGQYESDGNLLGRWRHSGSAGSTTVQAYIDGVKRLSPGVKENSDTYDIDVQHNVRLGANDVVVGGGYRHVTDKFLNGLNIFVFANPKRSIDLADLFAQDTFTITQQLHLIGGVKFEHNVFTGWEVMPNARLAYAPSPSVLLWAAISRAVRTPSRIDRELQALPLLIPAVNFASEQLVAYEAGYRGEFSRRASLSVTLYQHVYHDIRDTGQTPVVVIPIQFQNDFAGHIYGVEAWGTFGLASWWQLKAGINAMRKALQLKPGRIAGNLDQSIGNDPDYDAQIRSSFSLGPNIDLDVGLHFTAALPAPVVPAFTEASARLAWRPSEHLELALNGQNLLHDRHPETGIPATREEIPRSVYASMRWVF